MKFKLKYCFYLLLFSLLLFQRSFINNNQAQVTGEEPNKKLEFIFLLHANQANVPYGDVANDLCYDHVLKKMLEHPSLHFPLHFSGSLLTDLAWFNQSTLNLLRQGIETEQFEIIGSTYAQNIMYSHLDDYDNEIQIENHKQTIKKILNTETIGFWNPERCWNQERYVNLIVDGGYEYTFIEDQILEKSTSVSGYDEYRVRNTSFNDKNLLVFNDDKSIINYVDKIASTDGTPEDIEIQEAVDDLIAFLMNIYNNDFDNDYCVFYGQDMEAWGLWGEEDKFGWSSSVEDTVSRLGYLFQRLEEEISWLKICTPKEYLEDLPNDYVFEYVNKYNDGQADWMQLPSQDAGFDDWFDFNENSSHLNQYREQFELTRDRLKEIDTNIFEAKKNMNVSASEKLMNYAKFVYSTHQFEFGCIGCYFPWYWASKLALISAEAADYALYPSSNIESLGIDWDLDGNKEYILRNQKSLFVFSGIGGRLINWFDIVDGKVLLSNDIPSTYTGVNGQDYNLGTALSYPIEEVKPNDLWGRTEKSYLLRQKSFLDKLENENGNIDEIYLKTEQRITELTKNSIIFTYERNGIKIIKQYLLRDAENAIEIHYTFQNEGSETIKPKISLSFNPDNQYLIFNGNSGLNLSNWKEEDKEIILLNEIGSETSLNLVLNNDKFDGIIQDSIQPMFSKSFTILYENIEPGDSFSTSMMLSYTGNYTESSDLNTSSNIDENNKKKISNTPLIIFFFSLIGVFSIISMNKNETNKYE